MDKKIVKYLIGKSERTDISIVQMLADDLTPKEIAGKIFLSVRTVETRIFKLRQTFECRSVRGLIVLFFREGLIK